jgi:regulator of sigma E protease
VSWVLVFVGFSALIVLHEFGHFLVAKWTGMRVERFFLFFPPRLWSVKRGETEYGIGAIPLGGFVKITGMNPEELEPQPAPAGAPAGRPELATATEAGRDTPQGLLERVESAGQDPTEREELPPEVLKRAYYNQPVWKRVVVIAAGPAMNILIAFLILFGLSFALEKPAGTGVEVGFVDPDSPAAGKLQEGDRVVSVDGQPANNLQFEARTERFRELTNTHTCAGPPTDGCAATTPVRLVIDRAGRQRQVEITPKYETEGLDEPRMLVGIGFSPVVTQPLASTAPEAADYAVDTMWLITSKTVSAIAQIFIPEQREQLSGPVGSSRALNEAIGLGYEEALLLLALISLSLGVINLFPFLPLDGGHIFWSLVEKVRGSRVPFSVIERASAIGFLLILMLFAVGLTNDLGRIGDSALNP